MDTFQVMTNFEIGRRIVEHEQKGAKRAAYGTELLKELSARLTEEFGSGFSERNLDYMRKFYLARSSSKKSRTIAAGQVAFKSPFLPPFSKGDYGYGIRKPLFDKEGQGEIYSMDFSSRRLAWRERFPSISQTPSAKFVPIPISATPSRKSVNPFTLSLSHYVFLLEHSSKQLLKKKLLEWTRDQELNV